MPQKAYLHVDFEQPETLVFNRARMRRAFVSIGQVHMRDARRLVMKRGRSGPGDNPSYRTGKLARSIGYYVPRASSRRPGLMVKIAPNQKNGGREPPDLRRILPCLSVLRCSPWGEA